VAGRHAALSIARWGVWEIRTNLPSRRTSRILFFFYDNQIVVLHGFIKKTQRTPPSDIVLAYRRMREVTG
jgi:phage-related protein